VTTLQFIYPREREHEPLMLALVDVVGDVWPMPAGTRAARSEAPRAAGH